MIAYLRKSTVSFLNFCLKKKQLTVLLLMATIVGHAQVVSISASEPNANEAGPVNGEFTISITGPFSLPVPTDIDVFLSVNPISTATSGVDYVALPVSVNVPIVLNAGLATVSLDVLQDAIVEINETVIWEIDPSLNYSIGGLGTAQVTIESDDVVLVEFSQATGSDFEDDGGNLPALFITGTVSNATTVTVTDSGSGSATNGTDYTFTSPNVVNIPIGVYDGTDATAIPIPLAITGDANVEPDETINLALGLPTGDATLGVQTNTAYTIQNDDSVTVEFSQATGSDLENDGGNLPTLFVTGTVSNATTVTVTDAATGSATSGADYTFTSPNVVNIPNGVYDGTDATAIPITLAIIGDANVELDETINLVLSSPIGDATLGAQTNTTYTIQNDDSVTIEFSQATGSDLENDGGNLPTLFVTGTVSSATAVTVTDAGSGSATNGTDYTFTSPNVVNIPNGVYDGTDATAIPITLAITDDANVEPDETIDFTLGLPTGDASLGTQIATTYTIQNDDSSISLAGNVTQVEGTGGNSAFEFTVNRTGDLSGASSVNYAVTGSGGSPATATDFVGGTLPTGTVSFAANSGSEIITVSVNGDAVVEPDETFTVTLNAPIGSTIGTPTALGTITNDDTASISIDDVAQAEGTGSTTNFVFTVSIDGAANALQDIDFDFETIAGSATSGIDYRGLNDSGTITAGSTSTTIIVEVAGDTDVEPNEDFTVELSNPVNAILGDNEGLGTILNDDNEISFLGPIGLDEGNVGTTAFSFRVSRTGDLSGTSTADFVVTGDGAAPANATDFVGGTLPTGTVIFTSGSALTSATVNVNGDVAIEPDETFLVTLSNPSTGSTIGTATAIGTIANDDSCAAGTNAPVLNASEPIAFCDGFNKDLDDYTTSVAPAGATLKWSDSDTDLADESTHLVSSVVGDAGTYYGFFYDALNDCFSPQLEITIDANNTPSAGTPSNAAACNIPVNGDNLVDLDDQLTGADSGAWSITTDPSNGAVSIGTGNIVDFNGLVTGNYVFRYTTDGAITPCSNEFSEVTVTVADCAVDCDAGDEGPALDITQPTIFCDDFTVDLNDYVVGGAGSAPNGSVLTWSLNPDPLVTSAHRSSITSAPSRYYGFYFDDADGTNAIDCASPTLEITLEQNTTPTLESTAGNLRCGEGTLELNATASVGASLNWYDSPSSTTILGTGNTFITPVINATTSFYVEATANGCPTERVEVIATVNPIPSVGTPVTVIGCNEVPEGETTTVDLDEALEGEDAGTWAIKTDPSGQLTIGAENIVDFAGLPEGNYEFTFTTSGAQAPCTDESIDITIAVVDCLQDADNDGLSDDEEGQLGTDPNNPDTDGDTILDGQEVDDGTDPLDDCDSIGGTPLIDGDCDNDGLTNGEEVDLGTDPKDADSDNDGLTDGEEVLVEDDPTTEAVPEVVSDPLNPCDPNVQSPSCNPDPIDLAIEKTVDVEVPLIDTQVTFTITVSNIGMTEAINIEIQDIVTLNNGFEFVSSTPSKGAYDITTGLWTIGALDVGETETLDITVVIRQTGTLTNTASLVGSFPEDLETSNNSATVQLTVNRSECEDPGTLCNLFSPNGDGVNDMLILVGHQSFPNSSLQVFDRYGNSVYEKTNYDSTWDGTGENGDLPKGTYFYILDLGDGTEVTKGWIQIIR
ncbi:Calx-beta domain-containing protein [uncultured Croceitalea sp.]|uniref:Calx-beta domain-containing protein n=1 Tax=uncultured Croceitalea sp. TaxID=1798908 RepID=UPI0033067EFC